MFFSTIAAIITVNGVFGLVASSLVYGSVATDFFFNAAAACTVAGPLIFFIYVVIGLCQEFANLTQKSESIDLSRVIFEPRLASISPQIVERWIPEGLRRERKGPLNRDTGRGDEI